MSRQRWLLLAAPALLLVLSGCVPRVAVSPKIDLGEYARVGLIDFGSNVEGKLEKLVTHKVLEAITQDQKEISIIELGSKI